MCWGGGVVIMYTNFNKPPTPDPTKKEEEEKQYMNCQKCAHGRECGEECVLFGLLWSGSMHHCYSCCSGSLSDIQKRHCFWLTEREAACNPTGRKTNGQIGRQTGWLIDEWIQTDWFIGWQQQCWSIYSPNKAAERREGHYAVCSTSTCMLGI